MHEQPSQENFQTNQVKIRQEAFDAFKKTTDQIKVERQERAPVNAGLSGANERRAQEQQAANMALEELRKSTGQGFAMGERQAKRGYGKEFMVLVEKNLESIRQTKERDALKNQFGETFAAELKKAHPGLLTDQERSVLAKLAEEQGKPGQGKVGILPFIESFKRQAKETPREEAPRTADAPPSTAETTPAAATHGTGSTPSVEAPPSPSPTPEVISGAPTTPETPNAVETQRPETARTEKELREELSLHEKIAQEMSAIVEEGQQTKQKLGIAKAEVDEYFRAITAVAIRSYPSERKEVMRRLDLDSKYFLDEFQHTIEILTSEKLPEEIKKRIFEKGGVGKFEAFYQKIADKNGELKIEGIQHILRGHIADTLKTKETGLAQSIQETLRRQLELTKEYMTLRKFQSRQGEINQILGEVLSEREREPIKTQERGAYEAAERLGKELPEDIKTKKPGDFFGGLRRGGLQIKKALTRRLR
jgi:hypothetical protein